MQGLFSCPVLLGTKHVSLKGVASLPWSTARPSWVPAIPLHHTGELALVHTVLLACVSVSAFVFTS